MNEADRDRQIDQMCNFIHQEAKEKVNEIKLKVGTSRPLRMIFLGNAFEQTDS